MPTFGFREREVAGAIEVLDVLDILDTLDVLDVLETLDVLDSLDFLDILEYLYIPPHIPKKNNDFTSYVVGKHYFCEKTNR